MDNSNIRLNSGITNDAIMSINHDLKRIAKEKNVRYLDLNSVLSRRGELNTKYTEDGLLLNQEGYQELFQELRGLP